MMNEQQHQQHQQQESQYLGTETKSNFMDVDQDEDKNVPISCLAQFHGPFSRKNLSAHQHPLDELKSCLQKAIRRGSTELSKYAINQLLTFRGTTGEKFVMGNLYNRLCVIMVEDVSFSQIYLAEPLLRDLDAWRKGTKPDDTLYSIVHGMCG